jgi:hypothetical protein
MPEIKKKMFGSEGFCYKNVWDVVVQDTHVLARMFAAAMDGWLAGSVLPL